MTKDVEQYLSTLIFTLDNIHESDNGHYFNNACYDASFHLQHYLFKNKDENLNATYHGLSNVNQDIWNICTLISRVEWFRTVASQNNWIEKNPFLWMQYTALDIEHFHFELRSILDYVANALGGLAVRRPKACSSFRALYQWLEKEPTNKDILGEDASNIVLSAPWYSELRYIRDNIIHHGSHTLVFSEPSNGILFQVYKGWDKSIFKDFLMWNKNVVDFQLYAALYFARTFELIDRLGNLVISRLPQEIKGSRVMANYAGINLLKEWIERLIEKLKS